MMRNAEKISFGLLTGEQMRHAKPKKKQHKPPSPISMFTVPRLKKIV